MRDDDLPPPIIDTDGTNKPAKSRPATRRGYRGRRVTTRRLRRTSRK